MTMFSVMSGASSRPPPLTYDEMGPLVAPGPDDMLRGIDPWQIEYFGVAASVR